MKSSYIITISILVWVGVLVAGIGFAATSATVNATVTVATASVEITDGTIAYGSLATSTSQDTLVGNLSDTQKVGNNGNVTEDFDVQGSNATGGVTWTLATTIGSDQYTHEYATDGSTFFFLSTGLKKLQYGRGVGLTAYSDFKITTPSTDTGGGALQTVNVTVQASAS